MKKKLALFMALSMPLAASPVFAGGGHGSHGSAEPPASQAPIEDKHAKESEALINNCAQYVGRIQQRIGKLQTDIKGRHVGNAVSDELKKLEQNLKEANDIVRSLQIL